MALIDEVRTRISTNRILQLTNPDDPTATTEDTDRLQAAVDDADGEFQIRAGIVADATNKQHVNAIVQGAQYYLHNYSGKNTQATENYKRHFEELCRAIRLSTHINPATNSQLTVEDDSSRGEEVFPRFTPSHFADYRIGDSSISSRRNDT